jgi:hypothetical protein
MESGPPYDYARGLAFLDEQADGKSVAALLRGRLLPRHKGRPNIFNDLSLGVGESGARLT